MFPICDERGRVIAFGGRVLDDSKPKYINSPERKAFIWIECCKKTWWIKKNINCRRIYGCNIIASKRYN